MKTYESEISELKKWFMGKTEEHIETRKKNPPVGKDGELTYARQQVVEEYNRRLTELKKKYGKDTDSIIAMEQESNLTKAKKVHV